MKFARIIALSAVAVTAVGVIAEAESGKLSGRGLTTQASGPR